MFSGKRSTISAFAPSLSCHYGFGHINSIYQLTSDLLFGGGVRVLSVCLSLWLARYKVWSCSFSGTQQTNPTLSHHLFIICSVTTRYNVNKIICGGIKRTWNIVSDWRYLSMLEFLRCVTLIRLPMVSIELEKCLPMALPFPINILFIVSFFLNTCNLDLWSNHSSN